ncbi:biotin synthase auxiliary protein BsaP [Actinomadura hibisca]|uniref:biotin synthase auxiliary protein BsaP n=1 Tax=Actinomadura hibisca TaxID=68565 RepID=UPI000B1A3804|nr:hypothetical protein [Actinomadura hibisca]
METTTYCDRCGEPVASGGPAPGDGHETCRTARAMEPPRYCARCRRRMIVQVTPLGWTARCSRHGEFTPG